MKPAPFELRLPTTLAEALADMAEGGDDRRALAGGQSLIPLLNFRMARPDVLVDLGALDELRYIRLGPDGGLAIGAMTTQTALLQSADVERGHSVLGRTIRFVAHEPIRNRGTIGGSLAHLDPAAELPALALLLGAEIVASTPETQRVIAISDFIQGAYTSDLREGELLTEVRIPPLPSGAGAAVNEVAQRAGDFAVAGAASLIDVSDAGAVRELRVVVFGASAVPCRLSDVERGVVGREIDDDLIRSVAQDYADGVATMDDRSGSAAYRRQLTRVMVTRTLREAAGLVPVPSQ